MSQWQQISWTCLPPPASLYNTCLRSWIQARLSSGDFVASITVSWEELLPSEMCTQHQTPSVLPSAVNVTSAVSLESLLMIRNCKPCHFCADNLFVQRWLISMQMIMDSFISQGPSALLNCMQCHDVDHPPFSLMHRDNSVETTMSIPNN